MIQDALKTQLTFTHYATKENLKDVTHEESLAGPEGGGNSMNWVLGHIVGTRNAMLELVGGEAVASERVQTLYGRRSKPIGPGSDCEPFEELVRLFDASQEALLERLAVLDTSTLEERVPGIFDPQAHEPRGINLASFVFHEIYHAGQLGVLRRSIGKVGAIQ